ncbi:hypothetical protein [Pedobacter ginsengisoli]|uniref:hypothetical protein n=1 Tax=Pedobacter ginsengisoli TaxID=363852 RepID=UPI001562A46E|nr:hypothetical protein [Pedobacter ginsengisoli]
MSSPLVDYFYAKDSVHFYNYASMLGELPTMWNVILTSFTDFVCADWKAFALISGMIAFVTNHIDGNSIIVQKLIIVFFSSMILPYVFIIATHYFDKRKALFVTLLYGFLSYSLFYSAVLVRDVPIGFCFILLIYLFYTKQSLSKVPLFLALSVIVFLFRPEHGIFSLIFLFAYLYLYLEENDSKYKFVLVLPIFLLAILAISNQIGNFFNMLNTTSDVYLGYSKDVASGDSLGASLLKLPWGIRHIAAGLFSQTLPFPFYVGLDKEGLGFIPLSIAALFWFFIWAQLLLLLYSAKLRALIDRRLFVLFIIALILILGASVNADTRRIMAINPIILIASMNVYLGATKTMRLNLALLTLFLYLSLLGMYFVIKG